MNTIQKKLKDETIKQAREKEKKIKIVTVMIAVVVWYSYFAEIYTVLTTLKTTGFEAFVELAMYFSIFISYVVSGSVNTLIQFSFFNFCILIRAWLKQLETEFLELNNCENEKQVSKKVRKLVDSQHEIIDSIAKLTKSYGLIVNVIFVTSIFFLGMTLISTQNSEWFGMATTVPFVLFDAYMFCYGSQMIITQVNFFNCFQTKIEI
jgi:7tm Odorant receptor